MSDIPLHLGDNSPEYVAYRLMLDIAKVEKKAIGSIRVVPDGGSKVDPRHLRAMSERREVSRIGQTIEQARPIRAISASILADIAAVVLASFVHRENLARAMITGYKRP